MTLGSELSKKVEPALQTLTTPGVYALFKDELVSFTIAATQTHSITYTGVFKGVVNTNGMKAVFQNVYQPRCHDDMREFESVPEEKIVRPQLIKEWILASYV